MTIKQIIDDVRLQLLQGNPSDDSALEDRQLIYWLNLAAHALVVTEINSKLALGEMVPSIYQVRESCLISSLEESDCGDDECSDRISITLVGDVLTLNNDAGIIMIQTDDGDQVLKAGDIGLAIMFRKMRFSKPSGTNFIYYRLGSKIYIEGLPASDIPFDKFHVTYVQKRDYTTLPTTSQVVVSDLVLPQLIAAMVETGKLELYGTQVDSANDGSDDKNPVYHQQISNPEN